MNSKKMKLSTLLLMPLTILMACSDDMNTIVPPPCADIEIGEIVNPSTDTTVTTRVVQDENWICAETTIKGVLTTDMFPIFNINTEAIWPGAVLQGRSIQNARPDPLLLPRGPGGILINSLAGSTPRVANLNEVSQSNVAMAASEIIRNNRADFSGHLSLSLERVRSNQELALILGANMSVFELINPGNPLKVNENKILNSILMTIRQPFYTIIFERPIGGVRDFFAPTVSTCDLAPFVAGDNPPVYVSSVTYGRVFYLLFTAQEEVSIMESSISCPFMFCVGLVPEVRNLRNLKIQGFAVGGNHREAIVAILGGPSLMDAFFTNLRDPSDVTEAEPLSYTVRSLRSNTLVKNIVNVDFTVKDCRRIVIID